MGPSQSLWDFFLRRFSVSFRVIHSHYSQDIHWIMKRVYSPNSSANFVGKKRRNGLTQRKWGLCFALGTLHTEKCALSHLTISWNVHCPTGDMQKPWKIAMPKMRKTQGHTGSCAWQPSLTIGKKSVSCAAHLGTWDKVMGTPELGNLIISLSQIWGWDQQKAWT